MAIVQIHKFVLKLSTRRVSAVFRESFESDSENRYHGFCKHVAEEADLFTCGHCDSTWALLSVA